MKIIQGQSTFSREMITELIEENNSDKQKLINNKIEIEQEIKKKEIELEELLKVKIGKKNLKNFLKKIMLSSIIDLIIVNNDDIEIKLKMNLNDFIANSRPPKEGEDSSSFKK